MRAIVRSPSGSSAYRKLHAAIKARGHYLILPRPLSARIGTHGAAVLMALINAGQTNAKADGTLWATPEFIQNATGIRDELQAKVFGRLEKRKLVAVRGVGQHRYIKVNVATVRELLGL